VTVNNNLSDLFEEILSDLTCQKDTQAYIVSIYNKYISARHDLSKDSITLLFAQARSKHDFLMYQNLGDWIFFQNTFNGKHLKNASKDYYDTVARLSYNSCYKLINHQWKLFEELSDNFLLLEEQAKNKLIKANLLFLKDKNTSLDD
jgi:hypothetical protein